MQKEKVVYLLLEEDIQNVSFQELGRKLSWQEIEQIIPLIEKKINWYDAIADSINEKAII